MVSRLALCTLPWRDQASGDSMPQSLCDLGTHWRQASNTDRKHNTTLVQARIRHQSRFKVSFVFIRRAQAVPNQASTSRPVVFWCWSGSLCSITETAYYLIHKEIRHFAVFHYCFTRSGLIYFGVLCKTFLLRFFVLRGILFLIVATCADFQFKGTSFQDTLICSYAIELAV